jgi:hypothetical protein
MACKKSTKNSGQAEKAETAKDSAHAEKAKTRGADPKTAGAPKKVADLSVGDIVVIPGFDCPRTIRGAAKVTDGADAGKLDVALRDEAGEVEHARFGPDEEVQVVGKAPKGGGAKDVSAVPAASAARQTSANTKGGKTKAAKPEGAKTAKKTKEPKASKPAKEKKTSALDAAAKVLGEEGEPMNCQELIKAMSEKGYWKSPGGLAPPTPLCIPRSRARSRSRARRPGSRRRTGGSLA